MRTYLRKTRTLLVLGLLFAAAVCALGVAAIKRQQTATQVPEVISKVKNLEVVSVTVEQESYYPEPMVVIIIRNNSGQPVVSVAVESWDDKDASGISTDGFKEGDEPPSAVIEPYGTIKMQMSLNNLLPGKPLKVSGVMYADGSVDGEKLTIKTIQGHKERARKGENKKGGSPLQ